MKFPLHMDSETFVAGWAIDLTEEILLRDSLNKSLTRLEQSEKELKTALEKEHQLNDLKSRFVSMASHEFRTPLSTMLSSAYLLEKYTTTEQQANRDKHIHKIRESIHHMNSLLDDFLSLGKLEEGKTTVNLVEFDAHELMQEIVEELEPLRKNGQTIHYLNGESKRMVTDKKLLKNILVNVLSNAYKFSEENKNIWISCTTKNNLFQIIVKDEGIGISTQDQKHLFETFFRARNAQNIQGTGLGLHIIRRYAELLRGTIELESELNKGTTVSISLPISEKS
jgi:signal transduction histidine kinase